MKQQGNKSDRDASRLFEKWKLAGLAYRRERGMDHRNTGVLVLDLFEPADPVQIATLTRLVGHCPVVVHYYLREHVFPKPACAAQTGGRERDGQ